MSETNEGYPVVKENAFYAGFLILFTAPKTGKIVATGTTPWPHLLGETSETWAEHLFRETDIDPAEYDTKPK